MQITYQTFFKTSHTTKIKKNYDIQT